jgi:hypothetical protein
MGGAIEYHVREKIFLVNLTSIGTWRSNPDWDFVFNQVRKIIIRDIPGYGLFFEIPGVVSPQRAVFNEKNVNKVSFFMTDFGKLKTSRCQVYIIFAECVDEISHIFLL